MVSLAETSLKIYLLPARNLTTEAKKMKMDLRDRLQVQGINPGMRTPGKESKIRRRSKDAFSNINTDNVLETTKYLYSHTK